MTTATVVTYHTLLCQTFDGQLKWPRLTEERYFTCEILINLHTAEYLYITEL